MQYKKIVKSAQNADHIKQKNMVGG